MNQEEAGDVEKVVGNALMESVLSSGGELRSSNPLPRPLPFFPDSINRNSRLSSPSPSLRFPTFQIKPPPLPRLSQLLR
ncbi:unnamed protein product [Musa acuminata subsp. malaccensis]|uniref:(wild Malaysian banana) hypothetical protein n=1 Tax=Musa acuminata subsp. malaccensis TaxID=214687 RepID=A0A804J019_MUSAM|nr:unnamed protein product [Musa acuminata subsp. malaccensis]